MGLKLTSRSRMPRGFELEHAQALAALEQLVGRLVVERMSSAVSVMPNRRVDPLRCSGRSA